MKRILLSSGGVSGPVTIYLSKPTGGKAGKGKNRTRSFQIRDINGCIVKQFRFLQGDYVSRDAALAKAQEWIVAEK